MVINRDYRRVLESGKETYGLMKDLRRKEERYLFPALLMIFSIILCGLLILFSIK